MLRPSLFAIEEAVPRGERRSMDAAGQNDVAKRDAVLEHAQLALPSNLDCIGEVERATEGMALRAGFDEDTASNLSMVTREATINAIKHGNKFAPDKTVTVHLQRTARDLTVSICDQGSGLDPSTLPDPLDPANLLRSSGRGVFLMRAIMDEVNFRQLDPGTEVTLIKYRDMEATS
jgi:serine/threonine-protein kinase RsbW